MNIMKTCSVMRRGSCEWTLNGGLRVCNHPRLRSCDKIIFKISNFKYERQVIGMIWLLVVKFNKVTF